MRRTSAKVNGLEQAFRFEDGEYRQPIPVETEPQPVWVHFHAREGEHWFVAVALYPDGHNHRDYSWTIGAFDPDLGRFLLENEYQEPDSYFRDLPECVSTKRVRAIELAVSSYLQDRPDKVEELLRLERRLLTRLARESTQLSA